MNDQIAALISQLTLEEKASLTVGLTPWRTVGVERLGLKSITMTDGPHGVRRTLDTDQLMGDSHPATCFPVAAALCASWDAELIYEMGQALADEAIALGVDILLGPGINIKRSPLGGRNFEYFSEDPQLAGELAASLINGIQSKGVGTSLKHYAVNNQETRRFTVSAEVDERTLHEIYLRGFEIAVKQGKPWTVMCAYNRVNGEFCSQHHYLLTEVLRDQWGYEGFVVSDWGAVHHRVPSLQAGLELQMPGPVPHSVAAIVEAVKAGKLDEAVLNQAVERLLRIIFRAKQTPKNTPGNQTTFNVDAHHTLARRIAAESIVLLKNKDNLLPLSGNETLAVIGQAAQISVYQGGGSSHIHSTRVDSALELLKERAEVQFAVGDAIAHVASTAHQVDAAQIAEAVKVAQTADVALLMIALPASIESEGYDRETMQLPQQQIDLIQAVVRVNPRTVVVLNNGAAIDMRAWIEDVPAVIEAWLPGQAGAGSVLDVLFGVVNPSGKLGETIPLKLSDTPAYVNFPGEKDTVRYGEGLYVGYRGYDKLEREVLFPFGYGLSYTRFSYSNLQVNTTSFKLGEKIEVSLDVTNTGQRDGKEIVQVYVHDVQSRLPRPIKELKAFTKVALKAGETKRVTLTLDDRAFSYYEPTHHQWVAEAGEFDILVGSSSAAIHLTQRVKLTQGTQLPTNLTVMSTVSDWMEDPRGAAFVRPMFGAMFGGNAAEEGESNASLGVDMSVFMRDLPLTVLISFQGASAEASPEQVVKGMLEKLNAMEG